jgi:hypothetical protein
MAEPLPNLWGRRSESGDSQGANRRRAGVSQPGQQGKNEKRDRKKLAVIRALGGPTDDQWSYGRVTEHDRRARKETYVNGRNNIRSVRGYKELARVRQYPGKDSMV